MRDGAILILVRHGETSANLDGVWHGSTDTPLTDRGRAQAERVARYLGDRHANGGVTALYSSHLQRSRDTADAIGAAVGLPTEIDAGLGEYDLGSWEGKTYRELYKEQRLWHHMREDPDFAPHGGESPRQVIDRFIAVLRRLHALHRRERIVVVAHGGALSMVLAELLDGDYSQWRRVMENCAVSELTLEPQPELLSFNYTSHLDGL
ncbi:MAG: histidine phosphatase family protein [Myxococcota bacterium]